MILEIQMVFVNNVGWGYEQLACCNHAKPRLNQKETVIVDHGLRQSGVQQPLLQQRQRN